MKKIYLYETNGYLPARADKHGFDGWKVHSYYGANVHIDAMTISEAEAFKLLGEAMDHHEKMALAIANLKKALGL